MLPGPLHYLPAHSSPLPCQISLCSHALLLCFHCHSSFITLFVCSSLPVCMRYLLCFVLRTRHATQSGQHDSSCMQALIKYITESFLFVNLIIQTKKKENQQGIKLTIKSDVLYSSLILCTKYKGKICTLTSIYMLICRDFLAALLGLLPACLNALGALFGR